MTESVNQTEGSPIVIPSWYSDLRAWREEHNCTGPHWDAFALAAQERVRLVKIYYFGLGIIAGILFTYIMMSDLIRKIL